MCIKKYSIIIESFKKAAKAISAFIASLMLVESNNDIFKVEKFGSEYHR